MRTLQTQILDLFRREALRPLSTNEIVRELYPTYAAQESQSELSLDQKKVFLAKKAKLHRQLLYHLNKLVSQNILRIESIKEKGEKIFSVIMDSQDELVLQTPIKKIVLKNQPEPLLPIQKYDELGITRRIDSPSWLQTVNALVVQADLLLESLDVEFLQRIFTCVNDVVGLNDFERVLQEHGLERMVQFLERINLFCSDHSRFLCLIIDLSNVYNEVLLQQFVTVFTKMDAQNITVVFDVTSKEMHLHKETFEKMSELFAKHNMKLNIKNDDVHIGPYIIGRTGPYTLHPAEWKNCISKQKQIVVISQASIVVDVDQFFTHYSNASDFEKMLRAISQSLFLVNEHQRFHMHEYFSSLKHKNSFISLFTHAHNNIRFFRYQNHLDKMPVLLEDQYKHVMRFARTQESVYRSCGMALEFAIRFSHAYKKSTQHKNNELYDTYTEISVGSVTDLYDEQIHKTIKEYRQLASLFDGGAEIRFVREGTIKAVEGFGEIMTILNSYDIPFFCYKFKLQNEYNHVLERFIDEKRN